MGDNETGQISAGAAEIYEKFYLPGIFAEWVPRVIEAACIRTGQRVIDVACGTGVLARAVARIVGFEGITVGIDINAGMLDVAREKAPEIEWRQAPAEALPLDDNSFDSVVCQFGLMYFEDKRAALKEMMRVLRPGGKLAIVVWDKLENSLAYATEEQLFRRILGDDYADETPYSLGDLDALRRLFSSAGITQINIKTHEGTARFSSIDEWIYTDVNGWTIDNVVEGDQYELLLREARSELAQFVTAEGTVVFSTPGHIVTADKSDRS